MSLSLATKGIISNSGLSLVTKGMLAAATGVVGEAWREIKTSSSKVTNVLILKSRIFNG